ncbi:UDP-N-acetylmuramoyl-tripeptide--D-alanyl-D-alanine ligase [Oceanospirillum multiglobuliferum]|uniref:UDP-N-acetylmuramoyl-tripeptide--D-alanyl-D-alanine ligase n=1 Tax=Oceanospirillum multiglobuliferum TaxID=64969 RepID=A0A1T4KR88_9GAMM|nr:UDP-N-acetylmuramoyl-tripeptide--D-alanyl-D-alanine ligase [Oceanospirillum multiglobuliferum]OPX56117.1 hypothetical protein BTE48_06115 [Oceanospirillum multiglobuliferum]SJZ44934.1 UDP-N-acetylmuramoyl-tripeptide--D-alanyl-D-alanine ligase [Oceanospirillum multiglobuliferum]
MYPLNLKQLQHHFGGELICSETESELEIKCLQIDSRQVQQGDLFVALKGERFDAHEFLAQVIEQGAGFLVVSQPQKTTVPQWLVENTRIALGQIAQLNRTLFTAPLIAITGNSGKTTVKEMLGSILSQQRNTLITQGNFNNDIGVPLTLLRLDPQHQAAAIELGANHLGEIAYTTALAQPDVGVLLNVTGAHLGEFGSIENIAQAKAELLSGLPEKACAVINADDSHCAYWLSCAGTRSVSLFTLETNMSHFWQSRNWPESVSQVLSAQQIQAQPSGCQFTLQSYDRGAIEPSLSAEIQLPALGLHNVANALAAAAAALSVGVTIAEIMAGLTAFSGIKGRLQQLSGLNGACLINDTYNANPGSVRAAIDTLSAISGKKILVLGDIGELGDAASSAHADLGRYAKDKGIDQLYTVGTLSQHASDHFGTGAQHLPDKVSLVEQLKRELSANCTVLVKGSRSAAMETIVEPLQLQN